MCCCWSARLLVCFKSHQNLLPRLVVVQQEVKGWAVCRILRLELMNANKHHGLLLLEEELTSIFLAAEKLPEVWPNRRLLLTGALLWASVITAFFCSSTKICSHKSCVRSLKMKQQSVVEHYQNSARHERLCTETEGCKHVRSRNSTYLLSLRRNLQ